MSSIWTNQSSSEMIREVRLTMEILRASTDNVSPVNHGKWVLRYLFANLLDEEIKRDEAHRHKLNEVVEKRIAAARARPINQIQIPALGNNWEQAIDSPYTPRANGSQYPPMTPGGMGIGLATPIFPGVAEESVIPGSPYDRRTSQAGRPSHENGDYFSNAISSANGGQTSKTATTPATEPEEKTKSEDGKDKEKDKEKEKEKDSSEGKSSALAFGKKFRMGMSFGAKKLGRSGSVAATDKPAVVDEKAGESESSSNHEPEKEYEDSFHGVIQKIQDEYEKQLAENPEKPVETRITPSLPNETPVLKIPPGTKIMIQEETSGGSAELYRGTVGSVGIDADLVEKCAPQWLGEVLLLNTIPQKEPVKVSFVLHPYPNSGLPALATTDGNNRLNANKMLRVKKILAYVAERIDPTMEEPEQNPDALKPEEYLELYCNEQVSVSITILPSRLNQPLTSMRQLLDINMTLATLRAYIWKGGNDVVLHYKANGRKEIPVFAPESPATEDTDLPAAAEANAGDEAGLQPGQSAPPPVSA